MQGAGQGSPSRKRKHVLPTKLKDAVMTVNLSSIKQGTAGEQNFAQNERVGASASACCRAELLMWAVGATATCTATSYAQHA
jgi:hypothetical protein